MSKQHSIIGGVEALEARRLLDGNGLTGTYYNGTTPPDPISGSPSIVSVTRVDPTISFYWGSGAPAPGITADKFSARWVGQIEPRYSETYTFSTRTDEGVRLWIDGKLIIDSWARHRLQTDSGSITLQAGKRYDLRMEYYDFNSVAVARLLWESPSQAQEDVPTSQLYAQAPLFTPAYTPGQRIEAENFDLGARDVAYGDYEAGNIGKAYRVTDVDMQATKDAGGGYNVGWSRAGEWLEYTIDVATSGTYSLDIRLSAAGAGGMFHVNVDGVNATGGLIVPDTGNWQSWTTLTTNNIYLTAGRHVLRICQDTAGVSGYVSNLNWLELRKEATRAVAVSVDGEAVTTDQQLPVDFGTVQRGDPEGATRTFLVTNVSDASLSLSGMIIPSGFSLVEGLSAILAPGAADSFSVRLDTQSAGHKSGVVQFFTSDLTYSSFAFSVAGTVAAPRFTLKHGSKTLAAGDAVNFGTATVGSTGPSVIFTILNEGDGTLTLNPPSLPAGFILTEGIPSTLAPGASDTFTVQLDTSSEGTRSGSISVASNDIYLNPFIYAAEGTVSATTTEPPPTTTPTTNPVLVPGSGWTGPTEQPAAINPTAQFGDAKAIARWDVVPYQTFTGLFNVGVVAFHAAGIERVSFSVNGGEWADVYQMTLNPTTNVNEYWATLDASKFADGAIEVRAIAFPTVGEPRVLEGLQLFANGNATLASPVFHVKPSTGLDTNPGTAEAPFATLKRALRNTPNGATIILDEAGRYDGNRFPEGAHTVVKNVRWITVRAADSLAQTDVTIVNAPDLLTTTFSAGVDRIRWEGVSIDWATMSSYAGTTWFDRSRWYNSGGWEAPHEGMIHYQTACYITNSMVENQRNGLHNVRLARSVQFSNISADVLINPSMAIDISVDRFENRDNWTTHSDLLQTYRDHDNMIVYGLTAKNVQNAQMLFMNQPLQDGWSMRNSAFVDINIDTYTHTAANVLLSQLQGPMSHVLFIRIRNPQELVLRTDMDGLNFFNPTNVIFEACQLHSKTFDRYVTGGEAPTGMVFRDCIKI